MAVVECFRCHEKGHCARKCPNRHRSKNGFGRGEGGGGGCFNSGQNGHFARECTKPRDWAPGGGGMGDDRGDSGCGTADDGCFKCGKHGHFTRDCPNEDSRVGGGRGGRDCLGAGCFKCGQDGHFTLECPIEDGGGCRNGEGSELGFSSSGTSAELEDGVLLDVNIFDVPIQKFNNSVRLLKARDFQLASRGIYLAAVDTLKILANAHGFPLDEKNEEKHVRHFLWYLADYFGDDLRDYFESADELNFNYGRRFLYVEDVLKNAIAVKSLILKIREISTYPEIAEVMAEIKQRSSPPKMPDDIFSSEYEDMFKKLTFEQQFDLLINMKNMN